VVWWVASRSVRASGRRRPDGWAGQRPTEVAVLWVLPTWAVAESYVGVLVGPRNAGHPPLYRLARERIHLGVDQRSRRQVPSE
jgi:hypothetical protein